MKSNSKVYLLVLLMATLTLPVSAGSYLRVVSWNTLHMGWSGQKDWNAYAHQVWQDFGSSASAGNGVDLIFLQEVMYSSSITSFVTALQQVSGKSWAYEVTAAIGPSSYKERYAVVYRTDRVALLDEYVWNDWRGQFDREPQIVKVRHLQTRADYTFINWHTVFGTAAKRRAEIEAIADVFADVQADDASDQDVILLGDHNRHATSNYWDRLTNTSVVSPQASYRVNDKTSINRSCAFANPYDHFWLQSSYVTEVSSFGRDYIASMCGFRNGVSDHAPIWLRLYSNADTD